MADKSMEGLNTFTAEADAQVVDTTKKMRIDRKSTRLNSSHAT